MSRLNQHLSGSSAQRPIGLLGGTFDPIHLGHLRIAVELLDALGLDHVRLIPNSVPPHREAPRASNAQRAQWIRASIADEPGLVLDTREFDRDGPSFAADTLTELRAEFPQAPLVYVLGQDAFDGFTTWHAWESIPQLAHVVVVPRPGHAKQGATSSHSVEVLPGFRLTGNPADLSTATHGCLLAAKVTPLAVSSTQIRRLLAEGSSVRYLVADPVWRDLQGPEHGAP